MLKPALGLPIRGTLARAPWDGAPRAVPKGSAGGLVAEGELAVRPRWPRASRADRTAALRDFGLALGAASLSAGRFHRFHRAPDRGRRPRLAGAQTSSPSKRDLLRVRLVRAGLPPTAIMSARRGLDSLHAVDGGGSRRVFRMSCPTRGHSADGRILATTSSAGARPEAWGNEVDLGETPAIRPSTSTARRTRCSNRLRPLRGEARSGPAVRPRRWHRSACRPTGPRSHLVLASLPGFLVPPARRHGVASEGVDHTVAVFAPTESASSSRASRTPRSRLYVQGSPGADPDRSAPRGSASPRRNRGWFRRMVNSSRRSGLTS
jgi:hypothetical protein